MQPNTVATAAVCDALSTLLDFSLQTARDIAQSDLSIWSTTQNVRWCARFLNVAVELNKQLSDEVSSKCHYFARLLYWCRLRGGLLEDASLALEGLPASVCVLNTAPVRPPAAFSQLDDDTGCLDFLKAVADLPTHRVTALAIELVRQPGELEPVRVSLLIEALVSFVRHIVTSTSGIAEVRQCANIKCDRACLITGRGGAWVDSTRIRLPWRVFHDANRAQRAYWSEAAGEESDFLGNCCSMRCFRLIAAEARRVLPFTCEIGDPPHALNKPIGIGVEHAELAAFSRNCEASRRIKAAAHQPLRFCSKQLILQYRRMLVRALNTDALLVHAASLAVQGDMRIPSPTLPFVATHDWRQGITYRATLLRIHKIINKHNKECNNILQNGIFAQDGVLQELRASVRQIFR